MRPLPAEQCARGQQAVPRWPHLTPVGRTGERCPEGEGPAQGHGLFRAGSHTHGVRKSQARYGGCSELSSSRESEGPLVMGASRTGSLTSESQRFLCENGRTAAYYCFFTCMEPSHRQSDNHADRQQEPCLTWDRLWPHGSILLLEFVLRIT